MVNLSELERLRQTVATLDQQPPESRRAFLARPLKDPSIAFARKLLERSLEEGKILAKLTEIDNRFPQSNFSISAVDSALIGKELYPHRVKESYLRIINWDPKVWSGNGSGVDKYTSGAQAAIKRNEPYYIVLEQPPSDISWSLGQWETYVEKIARFYNGATFIIGNEINVPSRFGSYLEPETYGKMFLCARRAIKKVAPASKLSLYGEAYFGQGETLDLVIKFLENHKGDFGLRPSDNPFDVIAVHYYDSAQKLAQKIEFYRHLLDQSGYPQSEIVISELGVHLDQSLLDQLNEKDRAIIMVQNLALCADLVRRKEINTAFWFSMLSVADTEGVHGLYQKPHPNSDISPTKNTIPFLLINRLLQKTTGSLTTPSITVVSGETTYQRSWRRRTVPTQVVWNNTPSEQNVQVSPRTVAYNLYGETIPSAQGQIALPPLDRQKPFIGGGEPVFLVQY